MTSLLILTLFFGVMFLRELVFRLLLPWLVRANPELNAVSALRDPIRRATHLCRTSALDWRQDLFSLVKILLLHYVLLGVFTIDSGNVVAVSQSFLVLFLSYLLVDAFVERELHKNPLHHIDKQVVAVLLLICIANIIGILMAASTQLSFGARLTISIYSLLILLVGLSLRNSVMPERTSMNVYQQIEQEFARFTWIAVFIACFGLDPSKGIGGLSVFTIKLVLVEVVYRCLSLFVPRLQSALRWQLIYKFAIPISIVSVYGVIMGVFYV